MSAIANTKTIKQRTYSAHVIRKEDPITWRDNKKSLYRWLDNECKQQRIKVQVQWVVEIYIACSNLKGKSIITNQTLLKKYNERHPNNTISMRTLYRYLIVAQEKNLIKKSQQLSWNSPCTTRVLRPKLVVSSVPTCHTNPLSVGKGSIGAPLIPSGGGALETTNAKKMTEEETRMLISDIKNMIVIAKT